MLYKSQVTYMKPDKDNKYKEHRVIRSTWWLFCIFPIYSSEEIL